MSDYISRQASIDDLHTQLMYRMGSDDMKRRLDDWVKTLPSADVVQVVHGRWYHSECDKFKCGLCGYAFTVIQGADRMRYCPNCGAKMDGQE